MAEGKEKFEFKRTKLLTRPTISMKLEGAECFIKIESKMTEGKVMKQTARAANAKDPEKAMEPATLLDVINLETGEQSQLVVPAMMKSTLADEYPSDAYVGKCFHILNRGKKDTKAGGGQRYNDLLIEEIEVPESKAAKK